MRAILSPEVKLLIGSMTSLMYFYFYIQLHVTKIEELGAGSVYCQIIDIIHPGKVSMNKVNWKAKNEYEFISNLKILQTAFDKVGIKRYVEV